MKQIPVYKPYFTKETLKHAHDAIDSGWVSSHGKYLDLAKEKLAEITGYKYILLTNNGTSATHLVANALKTAHPAISSLICPNNVYVAALNMFKVRPEFDLHPIDADIHTWNFDTEKIPDLNLPFYDEHAALLVVHNLGNPVNISKLREKYPNTPIVEDNCEGFLGSTGTEALASSVSFFGNKSLTSGEGGAFLTNDYTLYTEMDKIRCQGITSKKFVFDGIGYNYRMTNIQAALLYGQLQLKDVIVQRKAEVFSTYKENLQHPLISFQKVEEGMTHSNWMFGIRINAHPAHITTLQNYLAMYHGIETRPMFPPIGYHSHYWEFDTNPVAQRLYDQCIILPSYPQLTNKEIKYISQTILTFLDGIR